MEDAGAKYESIKAESEEQASHIQEQNGWYNYKYAEIAAVNRRHRKWKAETFQGRYSAIWGNYQAVVSGLALKLINRQKFFTINISQNGVCIINCYYSFIWRFESIGICKCLLRVLLYSFLFFAEFCPWYSLKIINIVADKAGIFNINTAVTIYITAYSWLYNGFSSRNCRCFGYCRADFRLFRAFDRFFGGLILVGSSSAVQMSLTKPLIKRTSPSL